MNTQDVYDKEVREDERALIAQALRRLATDLSIDGEEAQGRWLRVLAEDVETGAIFQHIPSALSKTLKGGGG